MFWCEKAPCLIYSRKRKALNLRRAPQNMSLSLKIMLLRSLLPNGGKVGMLPRSIARLAANKFFIWSSSIDHITVFGTMYKWCILKLTHLVGYRTSVTGWKHTGKYSTYWEGTKWSSFYTHFQRHFQSGSVWILIKISQTFVPNGPIANMSQLVQVMVWCWFSTKPLPEPMTTQFNDE